MARPGRKSDAKRTSSERQHQALRKELPNQPGTPGAESLTHSKLSRSRRGPRQQEVCDIGARDQEHQPNHGHHDLQRFGELPAQPGEAGGHGVQLHAGLVQLSKILLSQRRTGKSAQDLLKEQIRIGICLCHAHARLHPRHQVQ